MTDLILGGAIITLVAALVALGRAWRAEVNGRTREHLSAKETERALSAARDEARATAARLETELATARKELAAQSELLAAARSHIADRRRKEIVDADPDPAAVLAAVDRVLRDIADQRRAVAAGTDHRPAPAAPVPDARTEAAPTGVAWITELR